MARSTSAERNAARNASAAQKAQAVVSPAAAATPRGETITHGATGEVEHRKTSKNIYDAKRDQRMLDRVKTFAPYQGFIAAGLENVDDIIKRYTEKGSKKDRKTLEAIAYGGHCEAYGKEGPAGRVRYAVTVQPRYNKETQQTRLAVEARELIYNEERGTYLPISQKSPKATVQYLTMKLEAKKVNTAKLKDGPEKAAAEEGNKHIDEKIATYLNRAAELEKSSNSPVLKVRMAIKKHWDELIAEVGHDANLSDGEIKAMQNNRDSYKMAIYVRLNDMIGKACGTRTKKPLEQYFEEYLQKGFIEGSFFSGGINRYGKQLIERGIISPGEARDMPSCDSGVFIRSALDGMPLQVNVGDAYRAVFEKFVKEDGTKMCYEGTTDSYANTLRAYTKDGKDFQTFRFSDDEIKSMAYGNLVTAVSDKGVSKTFLYDAYYDQIMSVDDSGKCLRAAYAAEQAEEKSLSTEMGAEQDPAEDLANELDNGVEASV